MPGGSKAQGNPEASCSSSADVSGRRHAFEDGARQAAARQRIDSAASLIMGGLRRFLQAISVGTPIPSTGPAGQYWAFPRNNPVPTHTAAIHTAGIHTAESHHATVASGVCVLLLRVLPYCDICVTWCHPNSLSGHHNDKSIRIGWLLLCLFHSIATSCIGHCCSQICTQCSIGKRAERYTAVGSDILAQCAAYTTS